MIHLHLGFGKIPGSTLSLRPSLHPPPQSLELQSVSEFLKAFGGDEFVQPGSVVFNERLVRHDVNVDGLIGEVTRVEAADVRLDFVDFTKCVLRFGPHLSASLLLLSA